MEGPLALAPVRAVDGGHALHPAQAAAHEQPAAYAALVDQARRHPTGLSPELLAAQALRVTVGADFAVAEDALAALVRRAQAARRDRLAILKRPAGRVARGAYRVGQGGAGGRVYDVWLDSLDPPAGSCSCPDYGKAALGLCKHLMVVLAQAPRRVGRTRLPTVLVCAGSRSGR